MLLYCLSCLMLLVLAPPKLSALVSTISNLQKLGATSTTVGTGANGELLGAFTFAWTVTGRIVQHSGADSTA